MSTSLNERMNNPRGYSGMSAFHKYWGKKPPEVLVYLIDEMTSQGEIVCDPFLGSGQIALSALLHKRRFLGIDLNPISIGLSKLIVSPPIYSNFFEGFKQIESLVKDKIMSSYSLDKKNVPTHYLWENNKVISIWEKAQTSRVRLERLPEKQDYTLIGSYDGYKCKRLRDGTFFQNSRINSKKSMSIYNLFTGRALRNIELLLDAFDKLPNDLRQPFKLCLTSASGQMSKMVFAIKNRGKTTGKKSAKIEVGSWAVGYWRPAIHFEINVWNCFERRVKKLLNILEKTQLFQNNFIVTNNLEKFLNNGKDICLINNDSLATLSKIPNDAISVIITDPPHSDRIPYLELSEMWNILLEESTSFNNEIVVSNAKERGKTKQHYVEEMFKFVVECDRVLKNDGILALMFSARDKESWDFMKYLSEEDSQISLNYKGYLTVRYSANSLLQDNRKGSLKDYILFFDKNNGCISNRLASIAKSSDWEVGLPFKKGYAIC